MTKLGKYEVLAELATGSMGVLYRARDTILDREVALKTILGTGGLDAELKERFYREARASARLHHPNVITVYELGEHEGLVFIALELLSGCDLRQFIARRLSLAALEKIAIMAAVCDGLHHAHQHGITHRDIKPSNIFLTDTNVPKILDFGVARLSASKLTVVGRVLGTPFYMAPEQIMGQPCDARSDLFALGIVTFEFLTFAHPFAGDSIPKRIINDNPDSVVERNPDVPPALDAILRKALARDPDQRYQSAEEFGRALREAARESEPAPPKSRVPEALKPAAPPPVQPKYANTEHKMQAILMALQGFDEAMEQRNLAVAREALNTVEALAKLDDRFATAAKESRTRLQELEASMPPEPPAPAPPRRTSTPAPVPTPVRHEPPPRTLPPASGPPEPTPPAPGARTTMPPAPAASSTDDATSMFHIPDLPVAPPRAPTSPPVPPAAVTGPRPPTTVPPVSRPPVTQPSRTAIIPTVSRPPATSTGAAARACRPGPNPAPPRRPYRIRRRPGPSVGCLQSLPNSIGRFVMVAGTAAALIVMALLIWLFSKGGKVALAPAVGTAQSRSRAGCPPAGSVGFLRSHRHPEERGHRQRHPPAAVAQPGVDRGAVCGGQNHLPSRRHAHRRPHQLEQRQAGCRALSHPDVCARSRRR